MSAADAERLCRAAKLDVLAVEADGRQITVTVAPPSVEVPTLRDRLTKLGAGGVTFSLGDAAGNIRLVFAEGGA